MERSTAMVLPSLTDNLPNVGLETMALGCVVIGTRRTGFEQLIIDGDSGILCEPGDPESLRAAIDRALALEPEARAAMGRSARSVVGRFHPDTTIPRHLEYFARIIGEVKGQRAADLALAAEPH